MKVHFTLDELVLATTLIAFGVAGMSILAQAEPTDSFVPTMAPLIYFGSAIMIGVGVGAPLGEKTTGGALGFLIGLIVLQVMVIFG